MSSVTFYIFWYFYINVDILVTILVTLFVILCLIKSPVASAIFSVALFELVSSTLLTGFFIVIKMCLTTVTA